MLGVDGQYTDTWTVGDDGKTTSKDQFERLAYNSELYAMTYYEDGILRTLAIPKQSWDVLKAKHRDRDSLFESKHKDRKGWSTH